MLPSELLIYRYSGETIIPKKLKLDRYWIGIATDLIACFQDHIGQPQKDLDRSLQEFEGESPDFRIKRGLAHLLKSSFSTFETISPLDPPLLRQRIFAEAAQGRPGKDWTEQTLVRVAQSLSQELKREVAIDELRQGLYSDLIENRIFTQFDPPEPEALLHRYNLSQVQGIFYRATHIKINAHRNVPGEYKLLFRYLKLFQLMSYIEGDADHGFTITIDGPSSLLRVSTRYGLALAKLIPALLHVTKWSIEANLQTRDFYTGAPKQGKFSLDSQCQLVSHYPPGKSYDSMLESAFADRWAKQKTDWVLEREVDLIPIPGSVMIPDFRFVHPDGRSVLLEIVGYWRPSYLQKKFYQVKQIDDKALILAISDRLNLEKAGVKIEECPIPIVWFKNKLLPKSVLPVLEAMP
ncbi:MAG: DUF790 family protein [Roseofilum sp. SBFL]|uniref:DUF790 family protein n=1 Tax=unclassified Roseofilum TaxID=2620099 RepID=UPI001AFDF0EE|nr:MULTISPECIES: DUF790 family protein [unclassified Roseofilum]MBP0012535.1 DUF790 family protein [Roseofilum sp. SID3]MBP0024873.1 DUF790 family protein [Roseofilum sp. SID2]MBP0037556.1 DUF790 family protein [Roseofilum sp. SID1]MBP0041886.1 DUF790 family protein [Roseofilum sp. SBFL]